jgi:TetR/AcrR family transcriptional regulator, repressor of fatR-cypB operon
MSPPADKRSAILQATLDLIAAQGFHGTPMSQVAKRSGVSTGIIYHYFESKDVLIHELYRDVKAHYSQALVAGQPQLLPFPENLKRVWLNAYHYYVAHPQAAAFLEQFENSPYRHAWEELALDDNFRTLMDMIQRHFDDGHLRPMPFAVFYELTLGVAAGLAQRQINGTVDLDEAALAAVAAGCVWAVAG